ncbi:MAG: hypothetical protein IJZ25_03675 [Lachnospiraceae bacterium]|nr:hypothetical protein [Lachnospiraceae bacterium]
MISIVINEVCKKWKSTILSAVLTGLVMFLMIVVITTYNKQVEKYKPYEELLKTNGETIYINQTKMVNWQGIEEFMSRLNGVKEYYASKTMGFEGYFVYGYDSLNGEYVPDLKEGVWYTEAKKTEADVEVVISPNKYGIGLGDVFELPYNEGIRLHVCGVLADESSFYDITGFKTDSSTYDWFVNYESSKEQKVYCFMSLEDMDRVGISAANGLVQVVYDEDISEDEKEENSQIYAESSVLVGYDFEKINERSLRVVEEKMMELIPIALGIGILAVISVVCLTSLDTMSGMKDYAIFYSCGMKWQNILFISFAKSIISAIIGFVIMFGCKDLILMSKLGSGLLFEFEKNQLIATGMVVVLMVLVSCIMPIVILKKNSPMDVFRNAKM